MKINLTKLLDIFNRVIHLNDDAGTTGDTSYIDPYTETTAGYSPYSFEIEDETAKTDF